MGRNRASLMHIRFFVSVVMNKNYLAKKMFYKIGLQLGLISDPRVLKTGILEDVSMELFINPW